MLADGTANLWAIDLNGTNRRQLTVDAQVNHRGMCATPDGKYLIFTSWREGKSNLWRIAAADGGNMTQLTDGDADAHPNCSPDSQTVIYQHGILSQPHLRKISVDGGEPVRLTGFRAKWSSISPDGSLISYFKMVEDQWHIGFLFADGNRAAPDVRVPENLKESRTYWSADGRNLFYIGASGSAGNIWKLPVDDGAPQPQTHFSSHSLADFTFSPDGKSLAVVRRLNLSDVILIENLK